MLEECMTWGECEQVHVRNMKHAVTCTWHQFPEWQNVLTVKMCASRRGSNAWTSSHNHFPQRSFKSSTPSRQTAWTGFNPCHSSHWIGRSMSGFFSCCHHRGSGLRVFTDSGDSIFHVSWVASCTRSLSFIYDMSAEYFTWSCCTGPTSVLK